MADILGLNNLVAQVLLVLGGALVAGNGYALLMDKRGKQPKDVEGQLRKPRTWFLVAVGLVLACWALASMISG